MGSICTVIGDDLRFAYLFITKEPYRYPRLTTISLLHNCNESPTVRLIIASEIHYVEGCMISCV
jgi:hypothetical protein